MKVTTNPQLPTSLGSLLDSSQQGRQALQEQSPEKQQNTQIEKISRQDNIDANRAALAQLQERLRDDKLKKLQAEFSLQAQDGDGKTQSSNLNLRENLGQGSRPIDTRPGQIIDIRV